MNRSGATFSGAPAWLPYLLLAGLVVVLYGDFWSRGGYADDFVYLNFDNYPSLAEAVRSWSYNARWTQAVLVPAAFRVAVRGPGHVDWWVLHALSVSGLAGSAVLLARCAACLGASSGVALMSAALFVLFPWNTQAVLWPAAALGYLVPAAVFLGGALLIFTAVASERRACRLIVGMLALAVAAFSVEQYVVPCLVVCAAAFLRLRAAGFRWSARGVSAGAMVLVAGFLLSVASGPTADRFERHALAGPESLWKKPIELAQGAVSSALVRPSARLRDPYYLEPLGDELRGFRFWGAVALWVLLLSFVVRGVRQEKNGSAQARSWFVSCAVGVGLCLGAFAPLAVVDYGVPARCLLVPGLGLALMLGYTASVFGRGAVRAILVGLAGIAAISIVRVDAALAERYWEKEQRVADATLSLIDAGASRLALIGFPPSFGAVPSFSNGFSLPGLVRWAAQRDNVEAYADAPFAESVRVRPTAFPWHGDAADARAPAGGGVLLFVGDLLACLVAEDLTPTVLRGCDGVETRIPMARVVGDYDALRAWRLGRGDWGMLLYTPEVLPVRAMYSSGVELPVVARVLRGRAGNVRGAAVTDFAVAEYYVGEARMLSAIRVGGRVLSMDGRSGSPALEGPTDVASGVPTAALEGAAP